MTDTNPAQAVCERIIFRHNGSWTDFLFPTASWRWNRLGGRRQLLSESLGLAAIAIAEMIERAPATGPEEALRASSHSGENSCTPKASTPYAPPSRWRSAVPRTTARCTQKWQPSSNAAYRHRGVTDGHRPPRLSSESPCHPDHLIGRGCDHPVPNRSLDPTWTRSPSNSGRCRAPPWRDK
nr:hypothetical protein [Nocardia acidivorans]